MGLAQSIGQAFHITTDELLTWNQIYEAVARAAGTTLNAVHIASDFIIEEASKIDWTWLGGDFMKGNLLGDKAVSTIFDNSKIKQYVPGFCATIPFCSGIKQTVKWFEETPERMIVHEENNRFMDTIINAYKKIT
jgi:nucleoside-diphosphate-sugar epimerase